MLLEATHPLFETVLPSYHPAVRMGEDLARTLTEAALTVDQIAQLFAQVEKDVGAKGGNRTILGKGVDAAVTVKKAYDWLKDLAEKGGQVSGFEGAYNKVAQELKNASGGDEGAVMKYIEKYRALAKNNPMAQKAIYGGLVLATGIAGYVGMGPAYIVLKPAVLGIMKFIDKLVQGEGITKSAIAGAEVFVAADIMKWAGGAIKTLVAGGIPTPPSIPAAGASAAAVDAVTPDVTQAANIPEPDASKLPGGNTGMTDREVRAANMQSVSNDMEKQIQSKAAPETPSAAPALNAYEKLNSDPKIARVISSVEKQIGDEMKNYKGKDYLEHFRKLSSNLLDAQLPNDLVLDTADREAAARTLVRKAMDATVSASPELSKVSGKITDTLVTLVKDGTILKTLKTDTDLENFITRGIKGYVGSIHDPEKMVGNPGIQMMLRQDINNQINDFINKGVDSGQLDVKDFKGDSFKLNAIIKMLRTQESINFDKPALTESQVMEAFRGTMFHEDTLTEAQVRKLFQQISEGPWGALQQVGGKIAQAAKQAGSAVAGSRVGQATSKAAGAVAKQIGTTAGNLANKVTADKLMTAWKAAGSKTDSNDIYEFLKSQGIDETVLKDAFKAAGIKLTAVKVSPQYKKLSAIVTKLSPADQQKLIQYLQAA